MQRRSDALARIEDVLNGVEQATSDTEVVKALEDGGKALAKLNNDVGGIERVESIMERVREGIQEAEDVGRVIAEMGTSIIDEDEVQEEFEAMLNEERERELKAEKIAEKKEKEETLVENLKNVTLEAAEVNALETHPEESLPPMQAEEPLPS